MDTVGKQKIWSFFDASKSCRIADNTTIRKGPGHKVKSYLDLAIKLAELQFRNQDYVLFFRGQDKDHKNVENNTSLKPSLFRPDGTGNPGRDLLVERFGKLETAEKILIERCGFLGAERLRRHRILRWSILQHYEVCPTPLLDVTHSARIAASFASEARPTAPFSTCWACPISAAR